MSQVLSQICLWGQTSNFLGNLAGSGCRSENGSNPERGLHPSLSDPAKTHKASHSHVNPHRNYYLLEALHQLIDKNAVELVRNKTSLSFFNQLFLVPKPNNKWRPILDLNNLNLFLKAEKFKMETPETTRTSRQEGEWVTSIDFKDAYFHIPIQEQSRKYLRFHVQGQTYQFKALPFGLSAAPLAFTVVAKEVKLMAIHKGIPRRLVGESQIPPGLSPAYSRSSKDMPRTRLAGEFGKVRTGTQTDLQFCRLPVRSQRRSGPTYTGPLAEPSGQSIRNIVTTGLSGPAAHVPNRFANSHRKASSPRPTAHETHKVASQKQLEGTRVTRKGDSNSQIIAPSPTMVATGGQRSHRPTIAPNKTCSANLYRRIKRRVGHSLKRTHCKRVLVPTRKQAAYKLSGTKSSLFSTERVPIPLYRQNSTCSNRQHYSGVLHKQGGRHEVGPTLCPSMENLDLVHQTSSNSQSPTYPGLAERGSRQAIPSRPNHSNRMVSPPRGFSSHM